MTHTAKHTPGPWVVSAGRVISTSSGQFYLTYGKDKYGNPLFKDFVELDHNAALIAAAPAIYEALQQSLVLVELAALEEWGRAVRGEQQPPTTEARDRLEKVKAALAQAEGK